MTSDEMRKLTNLQMREAVAERMGWTKVIMDLDRPPNHWGYAPGATNPSRLPDWVGDLHEAKKLTELMLADLNRVTISDRNNIFTDIYRASVVYFFDQKGQIRLIYADRSEERARVGAFIIWFDRNTSHGRRSNVKE